MSPLDSWLFIAAAVALAWLVWLFAHRVADAVEDLLDAWKEERA